MQTRFAKAVERLEIGPGDVAVVVPQTSAVERGDVSGKSSADEQGARRDFPKPGGLDLAGLATGFRCMEGTRKATAATPIAIRIYGRTGNSVVPGQSNPGDRFCRSRGRRTVSSQTVRPSWQERKLVEHRLAGGGPWRKRSLAVETGASVSEESRLKGGCSQDWLPQKSASNKVFWKMRRA
jgi:hypothetical protein